MPFPVVGSAIRFERLDDDATCWPLVPVAEMIAGRLSMMIAIKRVLILFMKFYSFGY